MSYSSFKVERVIDTQFGSPMQDFPLQQAGTDRSVLPALMEYSHRIAAGFLAFDLHFVIVGSQDNLFRNAHKTSASRRAIPSERIQPSPGPAELPSRYLMNAVFTEALNESWCKNLDTVRRYRSWKEFCTLNFSARLRGGQHSHNFEGRVIKPDFIFMPKHHLDAGPSQPTMNITKTVLLIFRFRSTLKYLGAWIGLDNCTIMLEAKNALIPGRNDGKQPISEENLTIAGSKEIEPAPEKKLSVVGEGEIDDGQPISKETLSSIEDEETEDELPVSRRKPSKKGKEKEKINADPIHETILPTRTNGAREAQPNGSCSFSRAHKRNLERNQRVAAPKRGFFSVRAGRLNKGL